MRDYLINKVMKIRKSAAWIFAVLSGILGVYMKYVKQAGPISQISSTFPGKESSLTQKRDSISLTNYLIAAISIYAIYLIVAFLLRDDTNSLILFTDWAAVAINAIAALCLLYAARVSLGVGKVGKRVFFAWMMMSLGQICFVIGDTIGPTLRPFR